MPAATLLVRPCDAVTNKAGTELPTLPEGFQYRLHLARSATPRDLKDAPRHRWFYFPHSYSPQLINTVIDHWGLEESSLVADPFVGSGTSLLVSRDREMGAIGFDISPLAVLVSRAKVVDYDAESVENSIQQILNQAFGQNTVPEWDSQRLRQAFTANELAEFWRLAHAIANQPPAVRDFLTTALLETACGFSRAVPDGGWFRWIKSPDRYEAVVLEFHRHATRMLQDLATTPPAHHGKLWEAAVADARRLPLASNSVDAIITSPPYPNRHDYTRVFHIELLLLGMSEVGIIDLRHRTIRSHVEAKAAQGLSDAVNGYRAPELSVQTINALPDDTDRRVRRMLVGYFEDMYLALREAHRVLKPGGRCALVVGNVRHAGVMVPVDEILRDVGGVAGLSFDGAWAIRLRGNSAQQMGRFGREASRESVVLLRKYQLT